MTLITVFMLIAAGALAFYFLIYQPPAQKYWQRFPTSDEYRQRHPQACGAGGASCWKCGSRQIVSAGLLRPSDYRRVAQCGQCMEKLWREMES